MNDDITFIANANLPLDRVLFLAAIAYIALLWFLKRPGSPRLLIAIGASVAALATIGAHYTQAGGILASDTLGAIERRPPSLLWMACSFLEAGGRLTVLIGFAWAVLKDTAPGNPPR